MDWGMALERNAEETRRQHSGGGGRFWVRRGAADSCRGQGEEVMALRARQDKGGGMPPKTEKARLRHSPGDREGKVTAFRGRRQTLDGSAADSCQDQGGEVTASRAVTTFRARQGGRFLCGAKEAR